MIKANLLKVIIAFIDEIAVILIVLTIVFYFLYAVGGTNSLIIIIVITFVAVLLFILIYKVAKVHKTKPKTGIEELRGLVVPVIEDLNPYGKVIVHGEIWKAKSIDGSIISKGSKVVILDVENLTLIVKKYHSS